MTFAIRKLSSFRLGRRVAALAGWLGQLGVALALLVWLASCQAAAPVAPGTQAIPPAAAGPEQVIKLTAKRFEYSHSEIHVKRGVPVVLEITALDHDHGFYLRAFKQQADLDEGKTVRLRFIPDKTGRFEFHCDNYCGDFHESMEGWLIVE
jgi:cytochrome c oxidase subunit 2